MQFAIVCFLLFPTLHAASAGVDLVTSMSKKLNVLLNLPNTIKDQISSLSKPEDINAAIANLVNDVKRKVEDVQVDAEELINGYKKSNELQSQLESKEKQISQLTESRHFLDTKLDKCFDELDATKQSLDETQKELKQLSIPQSPTDSDLNSAKNQLASKIYFLEQQIILLDERLKDKSEFNAAISEIERHLSLHNNDDVEVNRALMYAKNHFDTNLSKYTEFKNKYETQLNELQATLALQTDALVDKENNFLNLQQKIDNYRNNLEFHDQVVFDQGKRIQQLEGEVLEIETANAILEERNQNLIQNLNDLTEQYEYLRKNTLTTEFQEIDLNSKCTQHEQEIEALVNANAALEIFKQEALKPLKKPLVTSERVVASVCLILLVAVCLLAYARDRARADHTSQTVAEEGGVPQSGQILQTAEGCAAQTSEDTPRSREATKPPEPEISQPLGSIST